MAHIHTGSRERDVTASMYIVNLAGPEPRLFLHQHKVAKRWFQPGGHVEINEAPWQTVAHELVEETGFDLDQLEVLQPSPRFGMFNGQNLPLPFLVRAAGYEQLDHFHDDLLFAFTTREEPRHPLAADESQEVGWFTLAEIESIDDGELYRDIKTIARQLLPNWHTWEAVPATEFTLGAMGTLGKTEVELSSQEHPFGTPDDRYIIVRGRLWRRSNPHLSPERRETLVHELMTARRQVKAALKTADPASISAAHALVDAAKHELGERGPVWWSDGAPDENRYLVKNSSYADWYAAFSGV